MEQELEENHAGTLEEELQAAVCRAGPGGERRPLVPGASIVVSRGPGGDQSRHAASGRSAPAMATDGSMTLGQRQGDALPALPHPLCPRCFAGLPWPPPAHPWGRRGSGEHHTVSSSQRKKLQRSITRRGLDQVSTNSTGVAVRSGFPARRSAPGHGLRLGAGGSFQARLLCLGFHLCLPPKPVGPASAPLTPVETKAPGLDSDQPTPCSGEVQPWGLSPAAPSLLSHTALWGQSAGIEPSAGRFRKGAVSDAPLSSQEGAPLLLGGGVTREGALGASDHGSTEPSPVGTRGGLGT